jgi:hypothetical protein
VDLKKRVGPLPLWAWIGLMAGIGYIAWRRAQSGENEAGVEEGWFPTQGIPAEGASESGGAGGGVTAAEEFVQRAQEAAEGRSLAFDEGAEGRQIAHEEAVENRTVAREEAAETRGFSLEERRAAFEEWMARHTGLGKDSGKRASAKRASKRHKQGRGGRNKRAHEQGNPNAGQRHHRNQRNHQPGHTAKTDHRPARSPRARISAGSAPKGRRRR